MSRRMQRGKQDVLLNYLPEKTFDFEKIGTIARVSHIRGVPRTDLNPALILRAIDDQVRPWSDDMRPAFRQMEHSGERFILLEPRDVQAEMFPLVFWCQKAGCGVVVEPRDGLPPTGMCPRCRTGRLIQMRFVKIHRCGALEPLTAPACSRCHSKRDMALDTRESERFSSFRWVCRACGNSTSLFGGRCPSCNWPGGDPTLKNMSVELHRAGRTYYAQSTVLLNRPGKELTALLNTAKWQAVAAAAYLKLPQLHGKRILDYATHGAGVQGQATQGLTAADREQLRARGFSDDLAEQFERMQAELHTARAAASAADTPEGLAASIVERSGVGWEVWERAGQDLLEAVMPLQSGTVSELSAAHPGTGDRRGWDAAKRLGLESVALATEFPITTATFGYSRVDYQPAGCRLNPFPADRDHGGKFPVFVDVIQADAILLRLDPSLVLEWMSANGFPAALPTGTDSTISARGYFVRLMDRLALRESVQDERGRLVFGLLHSLSHFAIRRAALLCGLDSTSISEYLLPRTLTCAVYCNHRFGATIGALSALFEQSLAEWLAEVRSSRSCIYDPVCLDRGGNCHACSHLAETSCRFFNLNLGRPFLYGGRDEVVGHIRVGFLDFVAAKSGT